MPPSGGLGSGFRTNNLKIITLKWWARASVVLVFCLIFIGALVTSWQAGMAVPDWPLSFGSLNPEGWWSNFPVRLEHGHRLLAAFVGIVVGIVCSAVWGNFWALLIAFVVSMAASLAGFWAGAPPVLRAHLGVWPAALAFIAALSFMGSSRSPVGKPERYLAVVTFFLVCVQATLGGLRVTQETAGLVDLATVLRIVHGCVAQAFLMCLVALSVRIGILCRAPVSTASQQGARPPTGWLALAVASVYFQLVLGATMRHLGAGLAIPSFPAANPDGGWMPSAHNLYTDLNFGHTRLGALLVLLIVSVATVKTLRAASRSTPLFNGALRSVAIVFVQAVLGILVVLHQKPKTLATFHVVLGAALLASLAGVLVHALHTSRTSPPEGRL